MSYSRFSPVLPPSPSSNVAGMVVNDFYSETFAAPDADVVLLTGDGVRFGVYRRILVESSPFFKDMFSLPQSVTEERCILPPNVPVVEVTETAETMDSLLKLVYPGVDPEIETLDKLSVLLAVALKYDMTRAIETLRRLLVSPSFLEKEPTRVYAIACRHDLEHEARVASSHTLRISVLDSPLHEDLKYITAWSYHRLLDLHRRRANEALKVLEDATSDLGDVKCMQCSSAHYGGLCPPRWWTEFVNRAKEELKKRPTTDVVFSMKFLAESGRTGCQRCTGSILDSHVFLGELKKRIDELPAMIS